LWKYIIQEYGDYLTSPKLSSIENTATYGPTN
jgi:hypothetical protein